MIATSKLRGKQKLSSCQWEHERLQRQPLPAQQTYSSGSRLTFSHVEIVGGDE